MGPQSSFRSQAAAVAKLKRTLTLLFQVRILVPQPPSAVSPERIPAFLKPATFPRVARGDSLLWPLGPAFSPFRVSDSSAPSLPGNFQFSCSHAEMLRRPVHLRERPVRIAMVPSRGWLEMRVA